MAFARVCALFLAVMLCASVARAEPSAADVRLANTLYKTGLDEAAKEHWELARDAFSRASALYPSAIILANLAGAEVKTGSIVAGVEHYRAALKRTNELTRAEASVVERAMKQAEVRLAHVRIDVAASTPADRVEIDGTVLAPAALGVDYPVDPGKHIIVAARPGFDTARVTVTLAEGGSEVVPVVLHQQAPVAERVQRPSTAVTRRPLTSSPWFWIVAGAVVVGATATTLCVTVICRSEDPYRGNLPSVTLP